ncbi:hypothetical protein V8G54_019174 [Vigna mungo]|uniref:Uncharacterized protein n=1 Tax=Vigna mungo TaxID=3915 RepID=A0AAQ3NC20_VIGMU
MCGCFPPGPNPNWVYALSNPCGDNGASSSKDNPSEAFFDDVESYFTPNPNQWEQPNFFFFPCGDNGASCSKDSPSFLPKTAEYMASKGKDKTVWQKVRNALKRLIHPHMA